MHAEIFDKVIAATVVLRSKPEAKQGQLIESRFLAPLQKRAKETDGDVRKAYSNAYNTFASLRDGLKVGEVKRRHFTETIEALTALRKQVAAAEKKAAKKAEGADAKEQLAILNDSISDSGDGRNGHLQDRGFEVMKKYKKYEPLVPRKLPSNTRFKAIKIPIVAVTDPILLKERLARYKLCDDTIFGYPFVKNQVLVGLNSDWVVKEFKRQIAPAIEEVLEALGAHTGNKYMNLGVPKLRGSVYWVWIASERDMKYLNQASSGGHFRVTGWDLPFEVKPKAGS